MSLPAFSEASLEALCVAILQLETKEGLKVNILPCAVLNEEILQQLPETVRSRRGMHRMCGTEA